MNSARLGKLFGKCSQDPGGNDWFDGVGLAAILCTQCSSCNVPSPSEEKKALVRLRPGLLVVFRTNTAQKQIESNVISFGVIIWRTVLPDKTF